MSNSSIDFGEFLNHCRERVGLSIQALSRKSEVTAGYISRIENKVPSPSGEIPIPSPDILRRISPHLDVPYVDLMRAAGHLDDIIEKPDLYILILSGMVKIEGQVINDIKFAQNVVDIIKSSLALAEEWQKIKDSQKEINKPEEE